MGISFSVPCDPCINKGFQWLDNRGGYTLNLEKNKVALKETMEDLTAMRDDLLRRVTREENTGLQRLSQVQVWLTRVDTIEKIVNDLLLATNVKPSPSSDRPRLQNVSGTQDANQETSPSSNNPRPTMSRYRYGKKVFLTLRKVENLKCSGDFKVVAEQAPTVAVSEIPPPQIIVGQETMLEKAWNHLMDDEVGIMGMYGMGGVGKTTLLTQLNNKFSNERCGFDFVIWVVVSKELQVEKIQDEIAQEVGLRGEDWKERDKRKRLFNFLRKKKFVLFLDDIWEEVDLAKIGVPFPTTQNQCKVAFTIRSQDVCGHMEVQDPMEVPCLTEKDAFDLFQKKVGQLTLGSHPEILDLARKVAKECCGLPLALVVIGKTMSCKTTLQEWRRALDVLTSDASKFIGMEEKILRLLKYSYDNLEENVKLCLLYCALFPEDDRIPKEKLVDYWTGEGNIVDGGKGIERAENEVFDIIGSLIRAYLLMEAGTTNVRMHDVVREMALWIATDLGKEKEAFIVRAGVGLNEMPKVENWNVVRRMSLMRNKIGYLVGSPKCCDLTTLLMQEANLKEISSEFFESMPKLVVLDLSDNEELSILPDGISELASLQYLNLSNTRIEELPKGLQELKKLIHLDLEETRELKSIAGISSLQNLKVLKSIDSGVSLDLSTVKELETLKQIEILTTDLKGAPCVEKFLSSHRLTSCTQALSIQVVDLESFGIALPSNMGKLREFNVYSCRNISEICINNNKTVSPLHQCFLSLSKVEIVCCRGLKELTLLMFARNLKILTVNMAIELEDIIKKEKACEDGESGIVPFPKLIYLMLDHLDKLKNIYWSPLPFPCLEKIIVTQCPNLKKLPLDSKSGKQDGNGLSIKYIPREWRMGG